MGLAVIAGLTLNWLVRLPFLPADLPAGWLGAMVFNFDKPEAKDFTETVRLLAGLSKFVIFDITNFRSAPLELQATVPDYMVSCQYSKQASNPSQCS